MYLSESFKRHRDVADRLVARFGGPTELLREENTGPSYDPQITTTEYPITYLETGFAFEEQELIAQYDTQGIISVPVDVVPVVSDRIRVRGVDMAIGECNPLQPAAGGTVILYEVRAGA